MAEPAYDFHYDAPGAPWPEQGSWTWNDYRRLPEDGQRYEIIHGFLYVSSVPSPLHQFVVAQVLYALGLFAHERKLGVALPAPLDVLLPGVANPVQPDVVFLKNDDLPSIDAKNFEGVPELVVEVLSPGTSRVDRKVKLQAYQEAGVPEYWIVDPKKRNVVVHRLAGAGGYREMGPFGITEAVRSRVLKGFELKVAELFP